MSRHVSRAVWLGLVALVAACDRSGGPGYLAGSLEGPVALGAAVVDVRGTGIMSVEPVGTTRVFSALTPEGVNRVLLVGGTPGALSFRIKVEDPLAPPPSAVVVSAADGDNLPISSVHAFTVRIVR